MRNEDIAEAMQKLEASFKKHADGQLEKFTSLLEKYMENTEARLAKFTLKAEDGAEDKTGGGYVADHTNIYSILKTLRVNVPRFDGNDVEEWIYKIDKFFSLHRLPAETRMTVVAFHLDGEASTWFQWMEKGGRLSNWDVFIQELRKRFGASIYDDPLGRISKLVQTGTVATFRAEFEELMTRITGVAEPMFLNFFIWGLKAEIRRELLIAPPLNLMEAMAKAQLYEERNDDLTQRHRREGFKTFSTGPNRSVTTVGAALNKPTPPNHTATTFPSRSGIVPTGPSKIPYKHLTSAEIQERRDKGLCFSCDEKFSTNHRCKNRVLIMCGGEEQENGTEDADKGGEDVSAEEEVEVSLNAFSNSVNPHVYRIPAKIGKEALEVLIDTGSNNNFIQETLVEKLALTWKEAKRFKVYMGNGQYLNCDKICAGVELEMQGNCFKVDMYILPIWGLDIVLGMQWLRTLGPCLHDHDALTMEFQWKGRKVKLAGTQDESTRQVTFSQLNSIIGGRGVSCFFRVLALPLESSVEEVVKEDEIAKIEATLPEVGKGVIRRFQEVFREPTQFPPIRPVDHRIYLQPGTTPVSVRPYRYPYFQKDIIEKLVKEMIECGFIRHSSSPYSSPVLLVKKKDGSWRFCVDYRALNAITIKDKFPIPTIDELLDELGEAVVFSKLDLRAGYHQIRMDRRDVHKTTFRTHDGHYEFVVMPFGLSNAPSTFQAAMNQIFRPFLRRFVIVFFDDILVYSRSLEEHVQHLCEVLQCLLTNRFFAKGSKCQFFQHTIEYLGHLVSKEGVRADPAKVEAMNQWPIPKNLKQLRGFLGLTGYYRRFVAGYATIAAPLTELLKKDSFVWDEKATLAFQCLKEAMMHTPVLRLPDFDKPFVVETDASNVGIGGVLMQEGRPIAFFSKKLGPRMVAASTYNCELRAVVEAVTKWRQYLLGRRFIIRTDHKSLRELLTRVIQTPEQQ